MKMKVLSQLISVCRLAPDSPLPSWATGEGFSSVTRTSRELSIVCAQTRVPESIKSERDWRILEVEGTLDFGLTGILASIASPLAEASISIFAVSTFDTDYVLVKNETLEAAITALTEAGFSIGME